MRWIIGLFGLALACGPDRARVAEPQPVTEVPEVTEPKAKPAPVIYGSSTLRTSGYTWDAAFHPSGELLATATSTEAPAIWNVADGSMRSAINLSPDTGEGDKFDEVMNVIGDIANLPGWARDATDVAYSPDGARLAVYSKDEVLLLDVANKAIVARAPGDTTGHDYLSFTADGRSLAYNMSRTEAALWDLGGDRRVIFGGHNYLRTVVVAPDGSWLATAGERDPPRLWRLPKKGPSIWAVKPPIYSLAASPDSRRIAIGRAVVEIHQVANPGKPVATCGSGGWVVDVEFSPDGKSVAYSSGETALICDLATGKTTEVASHHRRVSGVAWSPDGSKIAVTTEGAVSLWWADGRGRALPQPGHFERINKLAIDPSGRHLVTAGMDGAIFVWKIADGALLHTLRPLQEQRIMALRFAGDQLLAALRDGELLRWSADDYAPLETLILPGGFPQLFTGAGDKLAVLVSEPTSGAASAIAMIDLERSRIGPVFEQSMTDDLLDARFLGDTGQLLGQVGIERFVLVDAKTGALTRIPVDKINASDDWLELVTRDGNHVLTCRNTGSCTLWDRASWKPIQQYAGLSHSIRGVAWSPDEKRIAIGDAGGNVLILDRATGKILWQKSYGAYLPDLAWTPDGRNLITGGSDGTARLWRLPDSAER